MFQITNFFSVFIPFYGMLGIWTRKVGYHNMWEFWFYNIIFGLFQAPYYAVSWTDGYLVTRADNRQSTRRR